MDNDESSAKHGLRIGGLILAGAAVLAIISIFGIRLFQRALYEWGVIGAIAVIAGVLLLVAWLYDRRHKSRLDHDREHVEGWAGDTANPNPFGADQRAERTGG